MPIIPVVVTWNGASFSIKIDTTEPVVTFRRHLQELTGVPYAGQILTGFPGGPLKASSWADSALNGDTISVIMSGECAAGPSISPLAPDTGSAEAATFVPQPPSLLQSPEVAPSNAKLLKVTVKTTQGSVMCLSDISPYCCTSHIKELLAQHPHCCGHPAQMKLAYKGMCAL